MSRLAKAIDELVLANKALDYEGVLDAYGHVSVRHPDHPDRFLLAWSRSPALIESGDIITFGMDGEPVEPDTRPLYAERFIHAGILKARPDLGAVVHSHAEEVLPFGLTEVPLRPVIHSASNMGGVAPVWDIADRFGDTDLLVRNIVQADDLAVSLGRGTVALMRGHGFVVAAPTLIEVLRLAVYTPKNARVQAAAMQMGARVKCLSPGEIDARLYDGRNPAKAADYDPNGPGLGRAWDYYRHRCACGTKT
ncbi:MAG TPA: class II aldolase/adducin family protein [Stellaceae bacterium]|jgi:HCOMODA/2-hydroxy-3-carboxy-muconic semialdehyde decarboxylase|nr:class II aldolase/adducin family protein [Stellaceae bacterium]